MADVKNMSDTLPLISKNTQAAAGLSDGNSTTKLRQEQVDARVVEVKPAQPGEKSTTSEKQQSRFEVTLEVQGRAVKVISEQPLEKGSQLKLQLLISSQISNNEPAQQPKPADQEIVQQIRVIQVTTTEIKNQPVDNQITALTLPVPTESDSSPGKTAINPADIASRLKQLSLLLLQTSTNKPLQPHHPLDPQQLKSWLAQKLPLTELTTKPDHQQQTSQHSGVYNKVGIAIPAGSSQGNQATQQTPSLASNRILPLIQQLLAKPDVPGEIKQQIHSYLNQLQSASSPQGSQQQVSNSGLSFEAKLVKLLTQIASGQLASKGVEINAKTATEFTPPGSVSSTSPSLNPGPAEKSSASSASELFKQLWQQSKPNQPATSQSTEKTNIGDILAATKSKLEISISQAAARITGHTDATQLQQNLTLLSEQMTQLQSSDQKAVLSKSLQLWLNQINTLRVANHETPQTLQQLATSLQERLPDGFRLLQTALANIELEQLQRLQQNNDQWQVNIPLLVRQDQQLSEVRMQLFKDKDDPEDKAENKQKQRWRIHLHFDLQQLGPLDVEIDMRMPKMAATFWSTEATTLAQLNTALTPLRSKLSQLGVEVETLTARHGRLPEQQRNQIHSSLVDLHT